MESIIEALKAVGSKISSAESIAVITHINPDGDCYGSGLALCEFCKKLGKSPVLYNENGLLPRYVFIADDADVRDTPQTDGSEYELVIFIDCGDRERAGKVEWVADTAKYVINIDHHKTNTMFGDLNIVVDDATATAVIIYDLFNACNAAIDKHTAELLHMGIITDSGNFTFSNTNMKAHIVDGELLGYGIDTARLSQKLFRETTLNKLKLQALTIDTLKLYSDGKIATLYTSKKMFAQTETSSEDSETFVGMARDIVGVEVSVFLRDTTDGKLVKVSLRSNNSVDVSKIAEKFGGGGHEKAAGCSIEGTIEQAREIIAEEVSKYL